MVEKNLLLFDLKNNLKNYFSDSIQDVVLFGSQANNKANEFSDYDILILLNKDYTQQDENRIFDICFDINLKYNILIDAHLLSVKELHSKRGRQPIFINALKTGIYA